MTPQLDIIATIVWIGENLEPHDVFDEDALMEWASRETPEDIFPEWELEEWALNHDFNRE